MSSLYRRLQALIEAGRRDGSIPPGPGADVLAKACLASVEAVTMALAGEAPADEQLAARVARGLVTPSGDAHPAG
jgi:hypothetical protein